MFSKNPLLVNGPVKEKGKMVKKHEEVFGIEVMYYNNTIDLVQTLILKRKAKTNLSGSVQFMVCDDKECLPPKTVNFQLTIK